MASFPLESFMRIFGHKLWIAFPGSDNLISDSKTEKPCTVLISLPALSQYHINIFASIRSTRKFPESDTNIIVIPLGVILNSVAKA